MRVSRRAKLARAIPLIEDVFSAVQQLSLSAWSIYFVVTFPFVLGIFYFWFDMANHTFAYERLPYGATALCVLFVIMKTGHVFFLRKVTELISGIPEMRRPRMGSIIANQTIVQVSGIVLLPLTLLFIVPFGTLYAFYQNLSVLDNGRKPLRQLMRESRDQAKLNPMENHVMLWLLCPYAVLVATTFFLILIPVMKTVSPEWTDFYFYIYSVLALVLVIPICPFGMIVALNIGATILMLPSLLKTFLGIETLFTISPASAFSPSFFVVVAGITYMCLDPLIKIAYSIRCFQGSAVHTGQDLTVKLARIKGGISRVMLLILLIPVFMSSQPAFAQSTTSPATISIDSLDEAIESTLKDRKFAWRFKRSRPEPTEIGFIATANTFIRDVASSAWDLVVKLRKWFKNLFTSNDKTQNGPGVLSGKTMRGIVVVLLVALTGIMIYVGFQAWRKSNVVLVTATPIQIGIPDLEDENTSADELASNEWLRLANELMEQGQARLAMRAYFFAGLAQLNHRRLIRLAPYKSNRDYVRELKRIAHSDRGLFDSFYGNLRIFESVWYGDHQLSEDVLGQYVEHQQWMSQHG